MSDIYFDKVIQIGRLYLDYIFYEFESEPILFSCVDDEKKLYLCLCSEIRYGQKWIITECELSTLKALIDRLDLPKEGIYIKDNKESARNYLWSKEC